MSSNPHLKRPPVSGKKAHTLDEINNSVLANGEKLTAISEDTSATRAITSATKAAVNKMQAKLDLAFKGPIALGKEVKAQRELTKRYVRRLRREQGVNKELAAENAKLQKGKNGLPFNAQQQNMRTAAKRKNRRFAFFCRDETAWT
mgnify:CR=1 FL=1